MAAQLKMKVWVEFVGADGVPQHREIAVVERIIEALVRGSFFKDLPIGG